MRKFWNQQLSSLVYLYTEITFSDPKYFEGKGLILIIILSKSEGGVGGLSPSYPGSDGPAKPRQASATELP